MHEKNWKRLLTMMFLFFACILFCPAPASAQFHPKQTEWPSYGADLAGRQIGHDGLIVVELQIDCAAFSKRRDWLTGLRVETDQAIAWRDVKNALHLAIRPIVEPSA